MRYLEGDLEMRRQIALALGGCLAAAAVGLAQQGVAPVVLPVPAPQYQSPFAVTGSRVETAPAMLPPATVTAPAVQYAPVQPVQTYSVPANQPVVMAAPSNVPMMEAPVAVQGTPISVSQPVVVTPQAPVMAVAPAGTNNVQYIAVQPVPAPPRAPAVPARPAVPAVTQPATPAQPAQPAVAPNANTTANTVVPPQSLPNGLGCAPGSPCASACEPCKTPCCQVCGPTGRFWVSGEYLLWWTRGNTVPPLVTTSAAGTPRDQAGVLGQPTTMVVYGGDSINDDIRSGFRLRFGGWLDCCQTSGLEGSYFFLGDSNDSFQSACTPTSVVSRPFTNTGNGAQDAQLVCFPNVVTGSVSVDANSSFQGFDVNYRKNLCCDCCYRTDWLLGFRYLRVDDDLTIREDLTVVGQDPNLNNLPVGTRYQITDSFQTRNEFYGPQIGLTGERRWGAAFVNWRGLIAFGTNHKEVTINGSTTITQPGGAPTTYLGGLLALPTNSGRYIKNDFAVVPEIGLNAGYQVTEHARVFVGYSFIYWSNVTRTGDVIDTTVNTSQLPPGMLVGPARPAFQWRDSDFWAQGISFGAELRY
ncbi:MAG: BBP7 family outer membrane beta-barrel protein [Gemmataceae bacterium]|nr:BBP7 family outer membrane beta-barrel protein [Gemmataceae bacterium]